MEPHLRERCQRQSGADRVLRLVAHRQPALSDFDGRNILTLLTENWDSGICRPAPGMGASAGGAKPVEPSTILCASNADCPPDEECEGPSTSTADANVQFQGSRLQGDKWHIP